MIHLGNLPCTVSPASRPLDVFEARQGSRRLTRLDVPEWELALPRQLRGRPCGRPADHTRNDPGQKGDKDLESEGKSDRRAGEAKENLGHAKDKVGEVIDKAKDKIEEVIDRTKDAAQGK